MSLADLIDWYAAGAIIHEPELIEAELERRINEGDDHDDR